MTDTRYIRLALFCEKTGYTVKAIERKIEKGVWTLNKEYRKAPDGAILVDMEGFRRWVEAGKAAA